MQDEPVVSVLPLKKSKRRHVLCAAPASLPFRLGISPRPREAQEWFVPISPTRNTDVTKGHTRVQEKHCAAWGQQGQLGQTCHPQHKGLGMLLPSCRAWEKKALGRILTGGWNSSSFCDGVSQSSGSDFPGSVASHRETGQCCKETPTQRLTAGLATTLLFSPRVQQQKSFLPGTENPSAELGWSSVHAPLHVPNHLPKREEQGRAECHF